MVSYSKPLLVTLEVLNLYRLGRTKGETDEDEP